VQTNKNLTPSREGTQRELLYNVKCEDVTPIAPIALLFVISCSVPRIHEAKGFELFRVSSGSAGPCLRL